MTNTSKKKGTAAETKVVKYIQEQGLFAERLALHGSKDEGDIRLVLESGIEFRLEVKAGKQTHNPSRAQLEEWIKQTIAEGKNSKMPCVLVVARYGRAVKDYDVYDPVINGSRINWYLDDWIEYFKDPVF